MEEAKTILLEVIIYIGVAAALFTGLDVFLALKTAHGRKSKYFNIRYKPSYGTKFYRARLVGKLDKSENKALYLVEIHPEDATKAHAWTVRETGLCGEHLLGKEKFYKFTFKEELYD